MPAPPRVAPQPGAFEDGFDFFAEEVEAVLERHHQVQECRVRGIPHAALGEVAIAEIVFHDPAPPAATDDLLRLCRSALEPCKVPRQIVAVERLPITATGKVQRWDA